MTQCKSEKPPQGPDGPTETEEADQEAGSNSASAEFPTANSFEKHRCSPPTDSTADKGIVFNTKEEIVWGEALPICGYLRVPKDMAHPSISSSFAVHVRKSQQEQFHRDSANFKLGEPEIRENQELYDTLEQRGELYFNTQVVNEYTVLGPGEYDISAGFFNIETERKTVRVRPGGWRGEIATFLTEAFCQGSIVQDFKDYLSIQELLSTADMDEATLAAVTADQVKAGKPAYEKYAPRMRDTWVEGMEQEHKSDTGVPQYVVEQIQTTCRNQKAPANSIYYIYQALRSYSQAD